MANIVAVTACPTGIAHTFMAAEALRRAAQAAGHTCGSRRRAASARRTP